MIRTLQTLFRATAAEAEEALIDANGTTLLAQHLRDAKANVKVGQKTCATLMARRTAEERRFLSLIAEIAEREDQARAALAAGQDDLASDIADRIIALEDHKSTAQIAMTDLDQRIGKMREGLSSADRRITALAADLRMARSSAQSRKVMAQIGDCGDPCALHRAEDMAARVRGLEDNRDEICSAMEELRNDPGGLDARIDTADLNQASKARRAAVLARLSSQTKS